MSGSTSSKYFLRESSLLRLYTITILSFCYFVVQLVMAHVAHSLILQVDAYHMLYNILSLSTSIITTKMCKKGANIKNTFGWTRIDVCGAVASLCFLAALCFSVSIEALQAMLHSHHEKMHYSEYVGIVGIIGLGVNFAACLTIGGYTYQQQGFLGSHKDGNDIVISPSARRGPHSSHNLSRFGLINIFRDFFGCFLVIICALSVYFWKHDLADFVDPSLTILEVLFLGILSYKFAKEAGYILLLTIPNDINVKELLKELYESFPEVCDIHEFHVWKLTQARIIASAHVVLRSTKDCWTVQNNIVDFLQNKGISHVTLQPEFLEINSGGAASPQTIKKRQCFLPCGQTDDCQEKKCCVSDAETDDHDDAILLTTLKPIHSHELSKNHRSLSLSKIKPDSPKPMKQMNKSNPELTKVLTESEVDVHASPTNIIEKFDTSTNLKKQKH